MLAGGVGAARFLRGLRSLPEARNLDIIVNTADDETFHGLHVSPDVDTIVYTLADLAPPQPGWGIAGDTFRCLMALERLQGPAWFRLGDVDLATHIARTEALRRGISLTRFTRQMTEALGIDARVRPMTDDPVRTWVHVENVGRLPFQEYLVKRRGAGRVRRIEVRGARTARPAPGVLKAIREARHLILPPSNPFVSLGPILALPGVRSALRQRRARTIAISPIVGSRPVKGPLHRMLAGLGHEVSAVGVARLLRDVVASFVLDERDARLAGEVAALGLRPVVLPTLMADEAASAALARATLEALPA